MIICVRFTITDLIYVTLKDIIISNTIIIKKLLQNKGKVSEKTDSGNIKFVEAVHGSFFIFKKTILENDLLFDNNVFLYYEENILGIKLKNKKLLAAINLDDIYYHNHKYKEETLKKIINTSKNRRNSQQYFMKHYLKTFFSTAACLADNEAAHQTSPRQSIRLWESKMHIRYMTRASAHHKAPLAKRRTLF